MFIRLILITLFVLPFEIHASDLDREKRWADQIVETILDGDAVWLNDGKSDFLGIYTKAEEDTGRSVILMHGTGVHPDWSQVIQPLRISLTEQKWNTLSIQMPILSSDADHQDYAPLYDEVAPRIDAAIDYLNKNNSHDIVLIGHSQGASMTAYYLSTSKQKIKGFVAIGMSAFGKDPRMNSINALEKINVPILDLYGNDDLESVSTSVHSRAAAAKKAGNNKYNQIEITGNHFYDGHEENLVKVVSKWLENLSSH